MCHTCTCDMLPQIARFMWPTWGPPGSGWPQVGPMLAPRTFLSGTFLIHAPTIRYFLPTAICHEHYKRIHGEKKYTCDLCEFSTRTRGHLQRHVARLHRPESYTCPYCLFTTFMLARYQNHIRQKHGVGREKEEKILQKLMADKPDQVGWPEQNGRHFSRRHFHINFLVWKRLCFVSGFFEICSS